MKTQNFKNKKNAFLEFTARIPHARNQLLTTKYVTRRVDTDTQTNKQTNKQTDRQTDRQR